MFVWKERGIEPKMAAVIIVVGILVLLVAIATVYVMVSGFGGAGAPSLGSQGNEFQTKVPSYPKVIHIYATLNYHSTGVYDMKYNATYTYYLSSHKIIYISLPNKNIENLVLKVDGEKIVPDITSYGIEIPLDTGTHTIYIGYSVKDLTSLYIELPKNKFVESLYIKVDVEGSNIDVLDESSLKPDNTYYSGKHITYIWGKSNAVLRNDIYIKRPVVKHNLDELPVAVYLFILSGIIFVGTAWTFKEKFAIDISHIALLSPLIGAMVTIDISFFLGVLYGVIGGIVAVIVMYLKTIKNNKIVMYAGVASAFVPLYSVIPYGNLVSSSAFIMFLLLIVIAYGGKFSYSEYINKVIVEKKKIEENFKRLKEVSEKLVSDYKKENKELQERLKNLSEENQKLLKKLSETQGGFSKHYCPNCGREISENFVYCPYCSAKLDIIEKCPKCGSMVTKDMKYCPSCGEKLFS